MGNSRIAVGLLTSILLGKSEGKRSLGRPICRWVGNIKIHLGQIEWDGIDWIVLAQDVDQRRALVGAIMNLRVRV
jgi:hypothetical protein